MQHILVQQQILCFRHVSVVDMIADNGNTPFQLRSPWDESTPRFSPSHKRQLHPLILRILKNIGDLSVVVNNEHEWLTSCFIMLSRSIRLFSTKSAEFYQQALQKHQLFAFVDESVNPCILVLCSRDNCDAKNRESPFSIHQRPFEKRCFGETWERTMYISMKITPMYRVWIMILCSWVLRFLICWMVVWRQAGRISQLCK